MKYGTWEIGAVEQTALGALLAAGYSPLTARVLSSRGCTTADGARALLSCDVPLPEPLEMKEMDRAVEAVRAAVAAKKKIAVFGDYDVDGITATCLLMDYLRSIGADCVCHIPGRLEEGYGLNIPAIDELCAQGVEMIITVDCGITALAEAEHCARRGVQLVITDHHECREQLPRAAAVVDPHRPDRTYPHTDLAGVGVAFKLAAALHGDQEEIARRYCDLFCLGTIADVMPLRGENRRLVVQGLAAMRQPKRLGLRALMEACDCDSRSITASTVGYILAPRINAAGRMEHAELAVRLFLSRDPAQAAELAATLCALNRQRQSTELEIFRQATQQLQDGHGADSAIVLAGENWHQGVVGIVASRLSEEHCRPTYLICLSGEHGKASSRSFGGFNLFASLTQSADLLEGYGGHELAAGFTISRKNIDEFRRRVCAMVERFTASGAAKNALHIDCCLEGSLLTEENVLGLSELEPCGTGCPKPVFCLREATVERCGTVGNGRHLRLRVRTADGAEVGGIFFSAGQLEQELAPGQRVDLAFQLQINEYRGLRSVQLMVLDLAAVEPETLFDRYVRGERLTDEERRLLAPTRADVTDVWRYLQAAAPGGRTLSGTAQELARAVCAFSASRHSPRRTLACLEILQELGFLRYRRAQGRLSLRLCPDSAPNPLENSQFYRSVRGE